MIILEWLIMILSSTENGKHNFLLHKMAYNDHSRMIYNDPSKTAYNDHSRMVYNDPLQYRKREAQLLYKMAYNDHYKLVYNDPSKMAYNDP